MDASRVNATPAWQVGIAGAGVGTTLAMQPSLLARSTGSQRSTLIGMGAIGLLGGIGGDALVDGADSVLPGGRTTATLATLGATAILPVATYFTHGTASTPRSLAALASGAAGVGVIASAAVGGGHAAAESAGVDLDSTTAALGTGAAIGALGIGATYTRGRFTKSLRGSGLAQPPYREILTDAPVMVPPGAPWKQPAQEPGRLIPYEKLGVQGTRFRDTVTRDPSLSVQPSRVYVPVDAATSLEERAQLAVREAEAIGALDRSATDSILINSTTGSGFVPRLMLAAHERMSDGRTLSVGMQYSTKRSVQSFRKIDEAAQLQRATINAFDKRLTELYPDGNRPKLLLFGESLGQGASERDVARNGLGPVDRVLWIGRPRMWGPWANAGLPAAQVQTLNSIEQLRALSPKQLEQTKVFAFNHPDDPVTHGGAALLASKTGTWPMRWAPGASGIQTMSDLVTATTYTVKPGEVLSKGPHDYRREHFELVRSAFGHPTSNAELARIRTASLADEAAYPGNAGV